MKGTNLEKANEELKSLLITFLIDEPPKCVNGYKGWLYDLKVKLYKLGVIRGSSSTCSCTLDEYCNDTPCVDYDVKDKELLNLINKMSLSR